MKLFLRTTILFLFVLFSCKNNVERKTESNPHVNKNKEVDFLKSTLQIEIDSDVKVLNNEIESKELFIPDFTLSLTIGLNNNQIEAIIDQIAKMPYYDELAFYRWKDSSRNLLDNGNYTFQAVQDSIAKTKYRGSWIKTEIGFEFIDFGKTHDIVHAWLNTESNSLKFIFVDM